MIRLDGISKIYSTDLVLKDINWEIKKGEKIGLVGSNGAGKTTQLKILSGEVEQTSGFIIKEGEPKIAYLKQEFDLEYKKTVRQELESSFKEIEILRKKMQKIEIEMKFTQDSSDLNILIKRHSTYERQFESLGGYKMNAEIEKILPKLGFSLQDADELVENFSGGWQMKIALGKIMLQKPDLLLLDEPTNHLDMDATVWLEEYLLPLKISIILISHDRYFLDKLCERIVFIENGISKTYKGNYSNFLEQKYLDEQLQIKSYQLQQKEIQNQKKFIEKFRASATRSSQAKSREKQLDKIARIDTPTKQVKGPIFTFPDCPRSSRSVVEIKNLSHGYKDEIIFFESNMKVSAGDKIAFLGPNGSGKSTLFKLILKEVLPDIGEITLSNHNLIISYYEQNQAEALDLDQSVIESVFANNPSWSQEKVRTFLGGFGFYKDSVFKRIKQLSGGEKAKLALALMIMRPCNFLLLDEPTNHLDMQSKENLEKAIQNYKGTVLLISHDRYFISKVANKIVEINDYQLNFYHGNYEYYLEKKKKMIN